MQKTIVTALAILASTAVASATDLPSKKAPAVPVFAQSQYYVGGNVGATTGADRVYSGGAVAGWNVLPFLAVEGTYDLSRPDEKIAGKFNYQNTGAVNVVPKVVVPGTDISVYAIAGLGYRMNSVSSVKDYSVYNIGGGVRYELSKSIDVDGRYRRVEALEDKNRTAKSAEDRVTLGVNYKF
jgi:opacity protein-like surface antigen